MYTTTDSAFSPSQRSSFVGPFIVAGVLLLGQCATECKGQVPAAVSDAVDRSESAKASAIRAFNRSDYRTALENIGRCLEALRNAESLAGNLEMKEFIRVFIASEKNRTILFCVTGVDNSDTSAGISNEWRQRIEKLVPPQEVKDMKDWDLVALDWHVYFAFGSVQQHLADYYIRKKDYSRANWYFAVAETYLEKYEQTAPESVLSDPEQKRWRALNKKRLADLLATKGITEGMYVQNSGVLQKWIAKVIAIDGGTIKVRITYQSSSAPRGFIEGKDISLRRDEIKAVESVSIDAAIRGYK